MSKYNTGYVRTSPTSAVQTDWQPSGPTHQGGVGYARDLKGETFLLAASLLSGEPTFYEDPAARERRWADLIARATRDHPEWTFGLLRWLRQDAHLRTAAITGAVVFVDTRRTAGQQDTAENERGLSRRLIDAVCQRADEPGEFIAAWQSITGRRALPKSVKRGLSDAIMRLYSERSFARYDSNRRPVRFADVIELVHPTGSQPTRAARERVAQSWRGNLFEHALNVRHGNGANVEDIPERLATLRTRHVLMHAAQPTRRALLFESAAADTLRSAAMSWEDVAPWLGSAMDAEAWRAILPSLGYMALLRNLRNLDRVGLDDDTAAELCKRLADPEQVARSRQLPFRFLTAYRETESLRWAPALESAAAHSLSNLPRLRGHTLILVDQSGSMMSPLSRRSSLSLAEAAALFGTALAHSCELVDLVQFGTDSERVPVRQGASVLRTIENRFKPMGGTYTRQAVSRWLKPAVHVRVVLITDEQVGDGDALRAVPAHIPCYTWNLAGYHLGHGPSGNRNRHTLGGLSDGAFRVIPLLEQRRDTGWPWGH